MRFVCLAALLAVALAAPARAQDRGPPTKLWSEFPLAPRVEEAGSSNIGPLLPPTAPESAPTPDGGLHWGIWLAIAVLGAVALLGGGARVAGPVAASRARVLDGRAKRRRVPAPRARVPERRPDRGSRSWRQVAAPAAVEAVPAQYAPPTPLEEPEVEDEPRRFVIRRTGLLRCRFVVLVNDLDGQPSERARSRSFSKIGSAAGRERAAEDAWDDLMNDLRLAGWEPAQRRSDYYVSLRRIDVGGVSPVMPTIDAYTHARDDPSAG
jgi:hypothetical protein